MINARFGWCKMGYGFYFRRMYKVSSVGLLNLGSMLCQIRNPFKIFKDRTIKSKKRERESGNGTNV